MSLFLQEFEAELCASPLSPPSSETLSTPRLEVGEVDSAPFSHTFAGLFDGLGLPYIPEKDLQDSPNVSYYLENITNIKDIVPDWQHDEIDEIILISPKRTPTLPTIHEEKREPSSGVRTATLSDFSFDSLDLNHACSPYQSCIHRETGTLYVIKKARATLGAALREKMILEAVTDLQVPFVSHLRWSFQEGDQLYSVFDHYCADSLFDYVQRHGTLDTLRTVFYASEVIVAISGLHGIGVVHQGLDPKNVMFDSDGHVVLANFGYATFSHSTESQQHSMSKNPTSSIMPEYRAPEILLGWSRDAAVDCWSFGMLIYFMLFGTHPYAPDRGEPNGWLYDRIIRSSISLESLRLISPTARDLILKCLERNPAVRWTIEKIKEHPYFALVDWNMVSSKRVEVPSVSSPPSFSPRAIKDVQRKRLSLQDTMAPIPDHRRSLSSLDLGQRRSVASLASVHNDVPIAWEPPAKPILKVTIPSIVTEEEEVVSEAETNGHDVGSRNQDKDLDRAERMAHFWDNIDKEERGSQISTPSKEFGQLDVPGKTPAPKLRKHRSSIQPRHLRFNFSTPSFQMKLKRKPRSTGALRDSSTPAEKLANVLPIGVHHYGSGIGFTYNMAAQVPSKLSVRSFTPSCGQNIFQGTTFSVKNFGRGLVTRKAKTKADSATEPLARVTPSPQTTTITTPISQARPIKDETAPAATPASLKEVGNGTFIRDMCRAPSWILSPPDSLASPMALVNGCGNCEASPTTTDSGGGPLTPATLVNATEACETNENEVNITIPKDLGISVTCDLSGDDDTLSLAPDSTLRLVPPSALRLSLVGEVNLFSSLVSAA